MKTKNKYYIVFLAIFLITVSIIGCNHDNNNITPTPPPTQTGCQNPVSTATVGSGQFKACYSSTTDLNTHFQFFLYDTIGNHERIFFTISKQMIAVGTIQLRKYDYSANYNEGCYSLDSSDGLTTTTYRTDSTHIGSITISQYDAVNHKISGTYSFTAKVEGSGTNTVNVTNGTYTNLGW